MSRTRKERILQKRRIQRNRRIASICAMVVLSLSVSILFHNFSALAERPQTYKYYTEVRVECGDMLWDIAAEHITEEYRSINEYIREIKEINHLGATLQYGQVLTIPYYSDVRK